LKWGHKKLYLLCNDKQIKTIDRQNIYTKKINYLSLNDLPVGKWISGDFLVKCSNNMVLVNVKEEKITIRFLESEKEHIFETENDFLHENILYAKGFYAYQTLYLIVVTSVNQKANGYY
jgi:hypothetical protein